MLPLLLGGNDVYALSLYLSLHEAKDGWKNLSAKIGVWSLVLQEKKCNFATIILLNSNSYTSQIKDDIMTVEITIVGIRKYLANGEDDYPELFARLPIGSTVYLRKEPTGSQFPGSVSVWDDNGQKIGNIAKTERRYIELEIPEGEMLPVEISGHSATDNCMYVKAENNKGFSKPYIREIELMEGETVFPMTSFDQRIQQLTSMMKTKINMLKEGKAGNADSLLATGREYAVYCCKSLDGETSFNRADILLHLRSLAETYPEIKEVYSSIYEQHKDIGRMYNDIKTQTYLEQYERIKENATGKGENGRSMLDDYLRNLGFANGGNLTDEVMRKEVLCLSELLSREMMKSYEKNTETDETFATALYSLNYSWNGIYRLYTRRIKLDFLKEMLKVHEKDTAQTAYYNKERNEEIFHFVYPELSEDEAWHIHDAVKRVVRLQNIQMICQYLVQLKSEKKVMLPPNPSAAYAELVRLGMPNGEGFSEITFRKYYNK